jgi:hypothetical protein
LLTNFGSISMTNVSQLHHGSSVEERE